jgi:hypothetical protein
VTLIIPISDSHVDQALFYLESRMISGTMSGVFAADILSDLMNLVGCGGDSVVGGVLVQSEVSEKVAQHFGRPIADYAVGE